MYSFEILCPLTYSSPVLTASSSVFDVGCKFTISFARLDDTRGHVDVIFGRPAILCGHVAIILGRVGVIFVRLFPFARISEHVIFYALIILFFVGQMVLII